MHPDLGLDVACILSLLFHGLLRLGLLLLASWQGVCSRPQRCCLRPAGLVGALVLLACLFRACDAIASSSPLFFAFFTIDSQKAPACPPPIFDVSSPFRMSTSSRSSSHFHTLRPYRPMASYVREGGPGPASRPSYELTINWNQILSSAFGHTFSRRLWARCIRASNMCGPDVSGHRYWAPAHAHLLLSISAASCPAPLPTRTPPRSCRPRGRACTGRTAPAHARRGHAPCGQQHACTRGCSCSCGAQMLVRCRVVAGPRPLPAEPAIKHTARALRTRTHTHTPGAAP